MLFFLAKHATNRDMPKGGFLGKFSPTEITGNFLNFLSSSETSELLSDSDRLRHVFDNTIAAIFLGVSIIFDSIFRRIIF